MMVNWFRCFQITPKLCKETPDEDISRIDNGIHNPEIIISDKKYKILNKNDVHHLEQNITNEMMNKNNSNNKIMSKQISHIKDTMLNYHSLDSTQLDYIQKLERDDVYLLLVLLNQCNQSINEILNTCMNESMHKTITQHQKVDIHHNLDFEKMDEISPTSV